MKTILWICNTPLPEMQTVLGLRNYKEGWLVGISNELRKREDIQFCYAFPQNKRKRLIKRYVDGIHFYGFYNVHKDDYSLDTENMRMIQKMLSEIKPDLIHIFGTELPHSVECVKCIRDKQKIIVSLQGIVSEYEKAYTLGISWTDQLRGQIKANGYWCILREKYDFYRRGLNEKRLLRTVSHAIGRTKWDKACLKQINADCRYYYCSETLRNIFYEDEWDINHIVRNRIFVSQGNYPIKGLHLLIKALPEIVKKYPETEVYVAGDRSFLDRETPYGNLIKRLIKKYKLDKRINFIGYLPEHYMRKQMLKAHIMLMPSLMENSPNSVGEAMLMGLPVVASNVGGVSSILRNETEGLLYPVLETKMLVKQICRLFSDDDKALSISQNAKKRARELYDKKNNLQQLLKIYEQVIK